MLIPATHGGAQDPSLHFDSAQVYWSFLALQKLRDVSAHPARDNPIGKRLLEMLPFAQELEAYAPCLHPHSNGTY